MEKQLNDSQLEEVSAGRLYAGFVSPGEDTGFRDALLRRKIKVEDREWELKIWQAYQDNARQWTGQENEEMRYWRSSSCDASARPFRCVCIVGAEKPPLMDGRASVR